MAQTRTRNKNSNTSVNLAFETKLWAATDYRDGERLEEKMKRLTATLCEQRAEATKLYACHCRQLEGPIRTVAGQTGMAPYVSLRERRTMEMHLFPASQQTLARRLDTFLVGQLPADEENRTPAARRYTLPPKLVYGKLPVKAAERVSETHS